MLEVGTSLLFQDIPQRQNLTLIKRLEMSTRFGTIDFLCIAKLKHASVYLIRQFFFYKNLVIFEKKLIVEACDSQF